VRFWEASSEDVEKRFLPDSLSLGDIHFFRTPDGLVDARILTLSPQHSLPSENALFNYLGTCVRDKAVVERFKTGAISEGSASGKTVRQARQEVNEVYPAQSRISNADKIDFSGLGEDANICVLLAAGRSQRFEESLTARDLPVVLKVIYPFLGKPLAKHPMDAARVHTHIAPIVIVGYNEKQVISALGPDAVYIRQPLPNPYGTAYASSLVCDYIPQGYQGRVTIAVGDTPLLTEKEFAAMDAGFKEFSSRPGGDKIAGVILSGRVDGPNTAAFGRLVVRQDGTLDKIFTERQIRNLIDNYSQAGPAVSDIRQAIARQKDIEQIVVSLNGSISRGQEGRPVITIPADKEYSEEAKELERLLGQIGLHRVSYDGAVMTGEEILAQPRFNPAIYQFEYGIFAEANDQITDDNERGEYLGIDVFDILNAKGYRIGVVDAESEHLYGVDTIEQLEGLEAKVKGEGIAGALGISAADVRGAFNDYSDSTGFTARFGNCDIVRAPYGRINATFGLTTRQPRGRLQHYIHQFINTRIFRNPEALENNMRLYEEAQEEALPLGWQRIRFFRENNSGNIISRRGCRVMNGVSGKVFPSFGRVPKRHRHDIATSLGAALVDSRRMCESVGLERWQKTRQGRFDHSYPLEYFDAIVSGKTVNLMYTTGKGATKVTITPGIEEGEYAARIKILQQEIDKRRRLVSVLNGLGRAVTRRDNKITNFIFEWDKATRRYVFRCPVDLDTIQVGNILDDLGDALRSAINPAGEEPASLDDVYIDTEVMDAIVNGFLGKIEEYYGKPEADRLRPHVYDAAMVFCYTLSLRFFADFLAGNVYFALRDGERPDANLYRAEVQMQELIKLEEALAERGISLGTQTTADATGGIAVEDLKDLRQRVARYLEQSPVDAEHPLVIFLDLNKILSFNSKGNINKGLAQEISKILSLKHVYVVILTQRSYKSIDERVLEPLRNAGVTIDSSNQLQPHPQLRCLAYGGMALFEDLKPSIGFLKRMANDISTMLFDKRLLIDEIKIIKPDEDCPLEHNKNTILIVEGVGITLALYRSLLRDYPQQNMEIRKDVLKALLVEYSADPTKNFIAGRASVDIRLVDKGQAQDALIALLALQLGVEAVNIRRLTIDDEHQEDFAGEPNLRATLRCGKSGLAISTRQENEDSLHGATENAPEGCLVIDSKGPLVSAVTLSAVKRHLAPAAAAGGQQQLIDALGELVGQPQDRALVTRRIEGLVSQLWNPRAVRPVIIAAGKGTRYLDSLLPFGLQAHSKNVARVNGIPSVRVMVEKALELKDAGIDLLKPAVVVSPEDDDEVKAALADYDVDYVYQDTPAGTGHAALQMRKIAAGFDGDFLVMWGTMPVVRPETLETAVKVHQSLGGCAMVYPAAWRKDPYAPLKTEGAVVKASQETHLEGAQAPEYGLDNIGAFVVDAEAMFETFGSYNGMFDPATGKYVGLPNGELGFPNTLGDELPAKGRLVIVAPIADPRECQGIKTIEDAKTAGAYIYELRFEAARQKAAEGVALVVEADDVIRAQMVRQIKPFGFKDVCEAKNEETARAEAARITADGDTIVAVITSTGTDLVGQIQNDIGEAKVIVVDQPSETERIVEEGL
jgi:bifunctional N-acetylglucosamine-1-phosphate-uridyltransferase/glucosamine-1-phosphate-acetyltransferase GlmU-like protein/RNA binding exosome subunit